MKIKDIDKTERELLSNIKQRPALYIGTTSLEYLQHFLYGYNSAVLLRCSGEKHFILPDNFNEFVANKLLGHNDTVLNYCTLINNIESDKTKAFELFFKLLDECLIAQGFEPIE